MPVARLRCQDTDEGHFGHKEREEEDTDSGWWQCMWKDRAGGAAALTRYRWGGGEEGPGRPQVFSGAAGGGSQLSMELQVEAAKIQWSYRCGGSQNSVERWSCKWSNNGLQVGATVGQQRAAGGAAGGAAVSARLRRAASGAAVGASELQVEQRWSSRELQVEQRWISNAL